MRSDFGLKGGMLRYTCINFMGNYITCTYTVHVHVHVCEDVVQIAYTPLKASAIGITPLYSHLRSTDGLTRHDNVPTTI